jgi:MEMO1 family protein
LGSNGVLGGGNHHDSTTKSTMVDIPISEFISQLDHRAMTHIEQQQPGAFASYLQQTRNTICGRHAIQVWLYALQSANNTTATPTTSINTTATTNGGEPTSCNNKEPITIQFIHYAQSSPPAKSWQDSSVSYASAVARKANSVV